MPGFGISESLSDVVVRGESPHVGTTILDPRWDDDLDVSRIVRNARVITRGLPEERSRAGDSRTIRADDETRRRVIDEKALYFLPEVVDEFDDETSEEIHRAVVIEVDSDNGNSRSESNGPAEHAHDQGQSVIEAVSLPGSRLSGWWDSSGGTT